MKNSCGGDQNVFPRIKWNFIMVEKLHNKKRDDLLDLTGLTMTVFDDVQYNTITYKDEFHLHQHPVTIFIIIIMLLLLFLFVYLHKVVYKL